MAPGKDVNARNNKEEENGSPLAPSEDTFSRL